MLRKGFGIYKLNFFPFHKVQKVPIKMQNLQRVLASLQHERNMDQGIWPVHFLMRGEKMLCGMCVLLHGWTRDCFVLILIAEKSGSHAVAYAAAAAYAVEVSMRRTVGRL